MTASLLGATRSASSGLHLYTEEELSNMTIKQIKEVAEERGYTITKSLKAEIIAEFLEEQG